MERHAFITGSHRYGTPREDSDIDLVVMMDWREVRDHLLDNASDTSDYDGESFSLYFGKLNLIVCTSVAVYDTWRNVTETLVTEAPVTREYAIEKFRAAFEKLTDELKDEPKGIFQVKEF